MADGRMMCVSVERKSSGEILATQSQRHAREMRRGWIGGGARPTHTPFTPSCHELRLKRTKHDGIGLISTVEILTHSPTRKKKVEKHSPAA